MIGGLWGWAAVALLIGFIPGITLFPWLASPVGPGLWVISTPFARIFFTVSQIIRGAGVLTKLRSNRYEIGLYDPDGEQIYVADRRLDIDAEDIKWGLFGKRPFGLTWEPGTDFHERVKRDEAATDGGGLPVNMAAAHRYLRGANDSDAISRTEDKAKANYGGGDTGFSDTKMAVFIVIMLLLGSFTAFFMLGGL